MKMTLLLSLFMVAASITRAAEEPQPYYPAAHQAPLTGAGRAALEHACKLVAAINALDWKTVAAAMPQNPALLDILKRDAAAQKDWHGIGAYRSSDYRQEDHTLIHRFGYGPGRDHPHEIWFHYTLNGDQFTFTTFTILGW